MFPGQPAVYMKRIAVLLLTFLLVTDGATHLSAQRRGQALIDSLQQDLANSKAEDTNKVNLLNGLSYACHSSVPDAGIRYGNQSLTLATQLGWKKGQAWANNSLGLNYMSLSNYPAALESLLKSLQLQEDLNNDTAISIVSGNIGSVYFVQGNSDKALEYYNKALKAARQTGNKGSELTDLGGIGNVYNQTGNYPRAVEYMTAAVAVARDIHDDENVARNLGNVANVYSEQKNYKAALSSNLEALAIAEQFGFKTIRAIDYGNIGETYLSIAQDSTAASNGQDKRSSLSSAIIYLSKGVAACKDIAYLAPLSEFSQQLSVAYALSGNYKEALGTYQQYVMLKDSVFSAANKEKITKLETQRAIDLKNKQIELERLAVAKKRNERGFFIGGIALLLLVSIILFRYYRVQKGLNNLLSIEKQKVERHTEELDKANHELSNTLTDLRATQQQLITVEKQKENALIRSRISQDIHDDISSELTRISWVSELAKAKMKKDEHQDIPGLLEKITGSSRDTVTKLGEIIWTVNPQNDTLTSLLAYMRTHITRFPC